MFKQISLEGHDQEVFIPVRKKEQIGINQLSKEYKNVSYYYRPILKKYHRLFYLRKVNKQKNEIKKILQSKCSIDLVHAHTVYSDGGTAYELYKDYGIEYIVNVRNTDLNWFYKYLFHLRPYMYKILTNAKFIVFISHSYKDKLLSMLPFNVVNKIKNKCIVIPNGIDNYWHRSKLLKPKNLDSKNIKLLFIGNLNKNKNIKKVLEVLNILKINYDMTLDIIGNGPQLKSVKDYIKKLGLTSNVFCHGYLNEREKILEIMDNCDIFVMPSHRETFGLVYIEAMSRGLPVVYTKGQGIDGFFEEGEIGYPVDPAETNAIVTAIENIIMNYSNISKNCIVNSKAFNWSSVSNEYIKLYNK